MILLPIFAALGWVKLGVPAFYPLGAVVGGYVFGIAMTWAAGCAGGLWYKWGAGSWNAAIALLGLAIGAFATDLPPLDAFREALETPGASADVRSATVGGLVGFEMLGLVVGPVLLGLVLRTKISAPSPTAWNWRKTGIAMGLASAGAWLLSALAGRDFGMAVVPGSVDAVNLVVRLDPGRLTWDFFFVIAVAAGGYLAAKKSTKGPASRPSAPQGLKLFFGGAVLGVSASIAGGCTVGHSLVGLPLLSLGSIVTTASILLGSLTMGYFEMRAARAAQSSAAPIATQPAQIGVP